MNHRGFTLLEIMVVLLILAAVVGLGLSRLNSTKREVQTTVRRFSVLTRHIYNLARLKNKTYRIAFQLNTEKPHQYWVESATGIDTLPDYEKEQEKDSESKDERKISPKEFKLDSEILKEPKKLPDPLKFTEIEIVNRKSSITDGMAYIHFLPQGLVEEAAIHISGGKNLTWTLITHPLNGKTEILPSHIPLKTLRIR